MAKSESSQPWLSESVVKQPWVKPHAGADGWRQKLKRKTSLMLVTTRFANLGDIDEISQIVIFSIHWHFVIFT